MTRHPGAAPVAASVPGRGRVLVALAVVAGMVAGGCGFHLRTWDLAGLERVRIVSSDSPALGRELARTLALSGVAVTEAGGDAEVIVGLSGERESRRAASVTGGARVAEYEMSLAVSFGAQDTEGQELIPTRTLRAERTYRLDVDNLIGSREEETLIVRELRSDLVQRMIRSLGRAAERARNAGAAGAGT